MLDPETQSISQKQDMGIYAENAWNLYCEYNDPRYGLTVYLSKEWSWYLYATRYNPDIGTIPPYRKVKESIDTTVYVAPKERKWNGQSHQAVFLSPWNTIDEICMDYGMSKVINNMKETNWRASKNREETNKHRCRITSIYVDLMKFMSDMQYPFLPELRILQSRTNRTQDQ